MLEHVFFLLVFFDQVSLSPRIYRSCNYWYILVLEVLHFHVFLICSQYISPHRLVGNSYFWWHLGRALLWSFFCGMPGNLFSAWISKRCIWDKFITTVWADSSNLLMIVHSWDFAPYISCSLKSSTFRHYFCYRLKFTF